MVEVYDSQNNFIALGHCQIGSITVRVLSFEPTTINDTFWEKRIQKSLDERTAIGLNQSENNNIFRLLRRLC